MALVQAKYREMPTARETVGHGDPWRDETGTAAHATNRLRVLVTGATSNLGAEASVALRRQGHRVSAVALPGHDRCHLDAARIPLHYADVRDEEALVRLFDGHDAVVHCAGVVDFTPHNRSLVKAVNVDGARACARAARRAGARRFIHVSSVAVYGFVTGRAHIDERTPALRSGAAYNDSKIDGELAVASEAGAMALAVLRPVGIYGRFDRFMIPQIAASLRTGKFAIFGDPRRPCGMVSTQFLADAIGRLLLVPPSNATGSWIAAEGAPPSIEQVAHAIASCMGIPVPGTRLPGSLAMPVAAVFEVLARVGVRPSMALYRSLAMNMLVDGVFDGGALRSHLELAEVDTLSRMKRVVRQLQMMGRL